LKVTRDHLENAASDFSLIGVIVKWLTNICSESSGSTVSMC